MKTNRLLAVCLFVLSGLWATSLSAQAGPGVQVPKGIYTNFLFDAEVNLAETAAYPGGLRAYPNPAADAILIKYFTTLLDNPAISGLAPQIPWSLLNPNDPGLDPFHPAANAYTWNPLDDLFIATDQWNRAHAWLAPKTIQLIPSAGFNSPLWIFNTIDASVCGGGKDCTGAGSCDGLFMSSPEVPVSHECGYTTLFFKSEGTPNAQLQFPLPWNSVYKSDFRNYLIALNRRVQQEPASNAFVSITMAGPTASSAEMILPNSTTRDLTLALVEACIWTRNSITMETPFALRRCRNLMCPPHGTCCSQISMARIRITRILISHLSSSWTRPSMNIAGFLMAQLWPSSPPRTGSLPSQMPILRS
jgi:hypothetical protein